eukprot:6572482-Alexandrium_andersonii.AAC.1
MKRKNKKKKPGLAKARKINMKRPASASAPAASAATAPSLSPAAKEVLAAVLTTDIACGDPVTWPDQVSVKQMTQRGKTFYQ